MIKKYAAFVASGYWQVAIWAAAWGWTMLFLPLGGIISSATLGLFALRFGTQRALLALALSAVVLAVLLFLTNHLLLPASNPIDIGRSISLLTVQWLPVQAFIFLQTKTQSLSLTFQALTGFFVLVTLAIELLVADSNALWGEFLNRLTNGEIQVLLNANPDFEPQYDKMLALMTGFMSSSMLVVWGSALLLANWLQSLVNSPGTFASMFTGIKLGKVISGFGLILFAVATITKYPLAIQLGIVIITVAIFQGIATVHYLLRRVENGKAFLWLFYGALILSPLLPLFPALVGIVGILESFISLRDRNTNDMSA